MLTLLRYWTLSHTGISSFVCDAIFQYLPADVTGTESAISCSKIDPAPWITYSFADITNHYLTPGNILLSGSYSGVHECTTPPNNRGLQNIIIGNGISTCYDAAQILTVAGNGTSFKVQNGGNVSLIAGQKISILPGAGVDPGGYLTAYITTTSAFCNSFKMNPLVVNTSMITDTEEPFAGLHLITIFPNPTSGIVHIVLNQANPASAVQLDFYTLLGNKIMTKTIYGANIHPFSLADKPAGIYLVRARSESYTETTRIVKN